MMRKLDVLILLFIISVFSCRNIKTFPTDEHFDTEKETSEISDGKLFSISGFVTYSNSYCGGARPTDEVLQQMTAPHPLTQTTFYVRQGTFNDLNKNIYLEIKTDDVGKLNFKLPPGDYVIIESNRKDNVFYKSVLNKYSKESESYSAADTNCMNEWLNGFLFKLTVVDSNVDNVSWNMHHSCWTDVPCIHYQGPLPP